MQTGFEGPRDCGHLCVTRTLLALEIAHGDLLNKVTTSFTLVGNSADSPEPLLRPLPATGLDVEMLDV